MNLTNLFENTTPSVYYYEQVAEKLPAGLKSDDDILDAAWDIVVKDLGRTVARNKFMDDDFDSDLIGAYNHIHKQDVAEGGPYDLPGIDYPRAGDTPAKPKYRGTSSPGVDPDDEAYFREIFRKKREAAANAEQDGQQGVAESSMSELDIEYQDYKKLSPREFFNMYRVTKQVWLAKYKSMLPQQGVAEADKKKDGDLEPQVKDVALQRAISRAKADFPAAGSGIEALAKDFMRSQDQDKQSFDQLKQAERKQDQMLGQISNIDKEQEQEIQALDNQNNTMVQRLQQLQSVNSNLEKKLAAMSGRRADKKSDDAAISAAPTPTVTTTAPSASKTKSKPKSKTQPTKSSMKSTAAQLAAPKSNPIAAMTNRITKGDSSVIDRVSGQSALPFEPSDNVLEPVIPQGQQNPRFAAARQDATDVDPKYYADLTSKIAKQAIADPEKAGKTYRVQEEEKEAKYSNKYQDMVTRVGQKAREQEQKKPVDIKDLARRLAAIDAKGKKD